MIKPLDLSAFGVVAAPAPVFDLSQFLTPSAPAPVFDLSQFMTPVAPVIKATVASVIADSHGGVGAFNQVPPPPRAPSHAFPKFRSLLNSFFAYPRECPPAPGEYMVEVYRKSPTEAHYLDWWTERCYWDGQYWAASSRGGHVGGWQMPPEVERTQWMTGAPLHTGCYEVEYARAATGEVVPAMAYWNDTAWDLSAGKIVLQWRGLAVAQ